MDLLIALSGIVFVLATTLVYWGFLRANDDDMEEQRISVHVWRRRRLTADVCVTFLFVSLLLLAAMWGEIRA